MIYGRAVIPHGNCPASLIIILGKKAAALIHLDGGPLDII